MKCQNLFSGKKIEIYFSMLSAETFSGIRVPFDIEHDD